MMQPIPVLAVTQVMKAVVKAAPAERRTSLWNALEDRLRQAQENSADRMPWDDASTVVHVSKLAAFKALSKSIADLIPETETRKRLLTVASAEADRLEDSKVTDTTKRQGRKHLKPRQCARDGCPETFEPSRPEALYHAEACRSAAYKARKKPGGHGTERLPWQNTGTIAPPALAGTAHMLARG